MTRPCDHCGGPLPAGPGRRYCSAAHRTEAYKLRCRAAYQRGAMEVRGAMALADLAGAAVGAAEYMVRAMRRGVVLDKATLARVEADLDRYRRAAGVVPGCNGTNGATNGRAGRP
jgi:hypothetical protein